MFNYIAIIYSLLEYDSTLTNRDMSSSILPIPGSRSAAKRVMRRQRIQDARAGQAVGVLNFFWEQPEVTKRDVNFLCLVWFMWNT